MKRRLTLISLLPIAFFLALAPTALASNTWYVDGVHGNDNNDCKSWQHACKTIGRAISRCSSGDSIMVAPATYKENLTISISLNVMGSSAATTIVDGGGTKTVFTIPRGATVSLSNLTIRNGYLHGYGYGGGILNLGALAINNSTISGNRAFVGAGIENGGSLIISNSTISGNSTNGGGGGAIDNNGTLIANNSTISGNSALPGGGGIGNPYGRMSINNSTISGNNSRSGGGIWGPFTTATLQNTIVADNSGGNCDSIIKSEGHNLSSDNTCNLKGTGDLNNTDPKLGTLGNYGGPTQTIPLLSGSPAIDAGNPSGCTDGNGHLLKTDQRGYPRPDKEDASGCDMGAYERQSD